MSELSGLFTLPPGVDFAREVAAGLHQRLDGPPEALARVTIFTNTRRMQRRLKEVFATSGALLLPRIATVDDLALLPLLKLPAPVPPLRRRLELTQLVGPLTQGEAPLAPRSAIFSLAESLSALLDEMEQEGVGWEAIAGLDVSDQSGHWARAQKFLSILGHYLGETGPPPGRNARMRAAVLAQAAAWEVAPPQDPVIVAGSTGSRGATALFIEAVARLPRGAVILPGFDGDLPAEAWHAVAASEEHPQHRLATVVARLERDPTALPGWTAAPPPHPARNRLLSLALRPAPVTDAWLSEGPGLGALGRAAEGLVLVEAADPRAEAEAIALRLRQAVEMGQEAALISPDRMLTRRVTAALGRWGLAPDDSAGTPLQQTPPGRFLRHVAALFCEPATGVALLALLKHPLCLSDGPSRGDHLRRTASLELELRRNGPPWPGAETFACIATKGLKHHTGDEGLAVWAAWLADSLALPEPEDLPLAEHVARHHALAERLAAGPALAGAGALWEQAPGRAALALMQSLAAHADAAGTMSPREYQALFETVLAGQEAREPDRGHPLIRIWGTLEARVQAADLMILAGLNEGSWPEMPAADPWLNRRMRAQAGLTSPERRIGLSAHDFQQAAAAREVWLSRALRNDEAETVPARWLSRLTSLMEGLPETGGPQALAAMRAEGSRWLAEAARLARPKVQVAPAPRPAPCPPTSERPTRYSVSTISRLYSDPYAVYARLVLGLAPLDPLLPAPDALLRGTVLHKIFERFVREGPPPEAPEAAAHLAALAAEVLEAECPWPAMQRLWAARIQRGAGAFLRAEAGRRAAGNPALFEQQGRALIAPANVEVTARADRIDLSPEGAALVYDYKSGDVPTAKALERHEQQLAIEAALIARGGFDRIGPRPVERAVYVSLKPDAKELVAVPDRQEPEEVWARLASFLAGWMKPDKGYLARRYPLGPFGGDYDHLARFGEWDETDRPGPGDVR